MTLRLPRLDVLVAGALLLAGGAPVRAQVTAVPESLRVTLAQGAEVAGAVTLTNGGAAAVAYCLDFDRPLQRSSTGGLGAGCGPPGELLLRRDASPEVPLADPYSLTMTPDGRLFVADWNSAYRRTLELDAALNHVRTFEHPIVAELAPFPRTVGITYNEDTHTLWWTNAEVSGADVRRVMLLEGTLDGVATGRRIVLPRLPGRPDLGLPNGFPRGAAYDPATRRYYFVEVFKDELYAVDTTGAVVPGYPLRLARYPTAGLANGLDVHGGALGGAEGVRLDVPAALPGEQRWSRVVVSDPSGADLGLETPIPSLPLHQWNTTGAVVRSRTDPNGAMYTAYAYGTGPEAGRGVMAFRPVPLSPSWLALSAWSGEVPAGGSAAVSLTFRAGEREPGEYRSTLVIEDTAGAVLASVPLTLVVEEATPAEPGPEETAPLRLSVTPNPARGHAAVTLTLARPASVRMAVYDLLGREVAALHEGSLPAGTHRLAWEAGALAPGLYVVRAEAGGQAVSRRVAVMGR